MATQPRMEEPAAPRTPARPKKRMTLANFWPRYVLAHQKPGTRLLHLLGTLLGSGLLIASIVLLDWRLFLAAFVLGYGFAWTGHFLVEHNKPATFVHPFLSFVSDYKMIFYMLTGRIQAEIDRARDLTQD